MREDVQCMHGRIHTVSARVQCADVVCVCARVKM